MNSRQRFLRTLSLSSEYGPPRFESDFSEGIVQAWKTAGHWNGQSPEEYFHLDRRENLPVNWSCLGGDRVVAEDAAGLTAFRRTYDPANPARLPENWSDLACQWQGRDYALRVSPWDEGLLQVIGVSGWTSLDRAIMLIYEKPRQVEAMMEHYADYLETLLDRVLGSVKADYAVFYEVIASNHALVISPEMYACFALPALKRVVACLERHGVTSHFVWSTGRVKPLIPIWLEAGINGLVITQTVPSGISYLGLRREYGRHLRLLGGLDWQTLLHNPRDIDGMLSQTARPLLEQGGYVPHLDDRVRSDIPCDGFRYYRARLNALIADVYAERP